MQKPPLLLGPFSTLKPRGRAHDHHVTSGSSLGHVSMKELGTVPIAKRLEQLCHCWIQGVEHD